MVEIYRIKDITEDVEGVTDFISGKISQIVVKIRGQPQFLNIELFTENDEMILKVVPKEGVTITNPRKKVVDQVDTGIYEKYLIHGNLKFNITGINELAIIEEIVLYIE